MQVGLSVAARGGRCRRDLRRVAGARCSAGPAGLGSVGRGRAAPPGAGPGAPRRPGGGGAVRSRPSPVFVRALRHTPAGRGAVPGRSPGRAGLGWAGWTRSVRLPRDRGAGDAGRGPDPQPPPWGPPRPHGLSGGRRRSRLPRVGSRAGSPAAREYRDPSRGQAARAGLRASSAGLWGGRERRGCFCSPERQPGPAAVLRPSGICSSSKLRET